MADIPRIEHPIPRSTRRLRFSRAAVGLLFATLVLAVVLIISTLQNINREQALMETFLLDKAKTIVRSIEAGSRATMMHHMGGGDPLHTLLTEYSKDQDIQYIIITDAEGEVISHIGSDTRLALTNAELERLQDAGDTVTSLDQKRGVFTLSTLFVAGGRFSGMNMHSRMMSRMMPSPPGPKILSIGLRTRQFDSARRQDVRHAIFMGAILFLVSSAGLYFLFLYQKMRTTSSNLADMKLYTENVIESIPVSLITLDAEDRVVSCNNNTQELFGLDFAAIKGRKIDAIVPGCGVAVSESCDTPLEAETMCPNHSGKPVPLRISCSPLVSNEGESVGKVVILRDMSAIKEMEAQLERSRRMAALGKMAAGIAHEIRNPLGTLRGFAQFFGNQPQAGQEGKDYSKLMISEIDRLNQTISGLLQFSRPREPQFQWVDVDQLMNKTVSMMAADLASKEIDLRYQSGGDISIRVDPDLLLQVLMNLMKNSINATDAGGRIELNCRREEHSVCITVTDNGCGMSRETRERMFDPFFTTTKAGTGLGLAVSHQIIEMHGGVFEVQTEPGSGTAITIRLPQ